MREAVDTQEGRIEQLQKAPEVEAELYKPCESQQPATTSDSVETPVFHATDLYKHSPHSPLAEPFGLAELTESNQRPRKYSEADVFFLLP